MDSTATTPSPVMSRPLVAPAAGHPSITASTHSDGTIQHDTPFPVNNSSKLAHPTDPVEQLYHSTVNEAPFSNNSHQIIIISHPNPQEQPSRNAPSALLRIIYGDSIAAGAAPFAINEPPTQSPLPTPANMDLDVDYDADDEASPSDGDRNEDDLSEFEFPDSLFPGEPFHPMYDLTPSTPPIPGTPANSAASTASTTSSTSRPSLAAWFDLPSPQFPAHTGRSPSSPSSSSPSSTSVTSDISDFDDSESSRFALPPVQMAAVILLVGQHVDDELYPELEVERLMGVDTEGELSSDWERSGGKIEGEEEEEEEDWSEYESTTSSVVSLTQWWLEVADPRIFDAW